MTIGGPGITRAREPFALDPEPAWGEDDRFSEWSESIGRCLYPLGALDRGRFFLGIDEVSEIYLVETWVASFGTMPQALENLILGVALAGLLTSTSRRAMGPPDLPHGSGATRASVMLGPAPDA